MCLQEKIIQETSYNLNNNTPVIFQETLTSTDPLPHLLRARLYLISCRPRQWGVTWTEYQIKKQNTKHHQKSAKNPLRKHFGRGKQPTRWGSIAIQQVVVLCGVEVHDDAGSIQQLLVTAGTGDAVVAVPAVTSVVQLLWLHLATHRSPEQGEETEGWVSGCLGFELSKAKLVYCWCTVEKGNTEKADGWRQLQLKGTKIYF